MSAAAEAPLARAAILGGGVIGGGWLARLLENGVSVRVFDPDPEAPRKLETVLEIAGRAQAALTAAPRRPRGAWEIAGSVAEAVAGADFVVEAVPERLDLKRRVYAEIEAVERAAPIASSTSGFKPSDLQAEMATPERLLVGHPFNPVYLLPLVEVVPGARTGEAALARAMAIYEWLGMKPLLIRREIDAFVADRLMEALWREALWLVKDGIATAAEVDDAVRYGCGLRWAQMGTFQVFDIAGGEAGMRHFMHQFGPALKWPWTKLMDVPEMDDALVETVASQVEAQAEGRGFRELERIRDENLVAIQQVLAANRWGAGQTLAAHEARLAAEAARPEPAAEPLVTLRRAVPRHWCDYNGHMNEARYGEVFSDAADAMMRAIGADAAYIAAGGSYFTVEIHIRFLAEALAGEEVVVTTQVLEGRGKKLRLFHRMAREDGRLLATGEQMLIHVSLETRAASEPAPQIAARLAAFAEAHAALPRPEGAGRAVGDPR